HLFRAAQADESEGEDGYRAAQAKALAGRAAVEIADAAIQVLGGDGSLADHGIERHWRDAKTCELNPSTRAAAFLVVADHLLEEQA
ncbi:MAG: acyl-CoA dehydrogenase, partial [Candidatus Eisenbacteria bacterium]|nr:acyl-CoA dehydrogenase [Candidatus Latescibacterota bacterium]MBD3303223.1 acyl-CoA dehydrogenase [Candidatus Eisenbacteria bacterium]